MQATDLPAESARSVWAAFDKLQDDAAQRRSSRISYAAIRDQTLLAPGAV